MEQIMLIGGFVPLPFVLYAILQTLRKHPYTNFFGVLLAYVAVLIPVGLFAWGTARQTLPPLLTMIIVISAAITFLFGFVLLIRELRRPGHRARRSYGLLGIGVSACIAIGLIATPTILSLIPNASASAAATTNTFPAVAGRGQLAQAGEAVVTAEAPTQVTDTQATPNDFPAAPAGFSLPVELTQEAEITPTLVPTNTPAATRTSVRQAVLPTITPTLAITVTPLATETSVRTSCDVLTLYNLNLRVESSIDSDLLLTIPYGTTVSAYEVNEDGWWRVRYEGQEGWVNGEYVSAMPACIVLSGN